MTNDYFGQPIYRSFPFGTLTALLVVGGLEGVWIITHYRVVMPGLERATIGMVLAMSAIVWGRAVLQHRRWRALFDRVSDSTVRDTIKREVASQLLLNLQAAFLILVLALGLIHTMLRMR